MKRAIQLGKSIAFYEYGCMRIGKTVALPSGGSGGAIRPCPRHRRWQWNLAPRM